MRITELQDGQVVKYRLGRAGRHEVEWGPWKDGPMYVRRRDKDYKRGREFYRAGDIICIVPMNDEAWAEHTQEKGGFSPPNLFVAEDYYMEIEGLTA